MKKLILTYLETEERNKIAALQLFAGISKLMERLESKKKFSWVKGDSQIIIREMEMERKKYGKKINSGREGTKEEVKEPDKSDQKVKEVQPVEKKDLGKRRKELPKNTKGNSSTPQDRNIYLNKSEQDLYGGAGHRM